MPTYSLKNLKSDDTWDVICSWNELQGMLDDDSNISLMPSSPKIVSGVKGLNSHVPAGFKDVLSRVKSGAGKNNKIKTHL